MSHDASQADVSPGRLTADEAVALAAHVAELAKAGLPLSGGLRALAEELPRGRLAGVLRAMAGQLERGTPLPEVLDAQGNRFPAHVRGLLLAGVRSGRLPEALEEFVNLERERAELRRRTWRALAYPLLLLAMLGGMLVLFDQYIAVEFRSIYEDFDADLPDLTRIVLQNSGMGSWVARIGATLLAAVAALAWALPRSTTGPRVLYALPLLGPVWRYGRLARLGRILALLIEQQVPLPEAMRLGAAGAADAWLAAGCRRVAEELEAGSTLAESVARQRQFPPSMHPLIAWGQEASAPAEAFRAVAEMYEGRARSQGNYLESILLPLVFIVVIAFVAVVVLALFMPMVSLVLKLT